MATYAIGDVQAVWIAGGKLAGPSLDDRAGCAALLSLLLKKNLIAETGRR